LCEIENARRRPLRARVRVVRRAPCRGGAALRGHSLRDYYADFLTAAADEQLIEAPPAAAETETQFIV
jgi:hypothetical protein